MNKRIGWSVGVAVALLLALGWWLSRSDQVVEGSADQSAQTSKDRPNKPHFPYRTKRRTGSQPVQAAPQADAQADAPVESTRLVYPEGVLVSCPAPGQEDGLYMVTGKAPWKHTRVIDGQFEGVLTKPHTGEGGLFKDYVHGGLLHWSPEGCRFEPRQDVIVTGVVIDNDRNPVPNIEVKGCVGELTRSGANGTFEVTIARYATCWAFAFTDDDDGFGKGELVAFNGETSHLELPMPETTVSVAKQHAQLKQFARMMMDRLDKNHKQWASPVSNALDQNPDNPTIQRWADEEIDQLNRMYDDLEYFLSPEAGAEDLRDGWLFGLGG